MLHKYYNPPHIPDTPGPYQNLSWYDLPGYGLPLNFTPCPPYRNWDGVEHRAYPRRGDGQYLFKNAIDGGGDGQFLRPTPLTSLREYTMMQLMNEITDKVGWHIKIFNDKIVAKLKLEILNAEGRDVTERMVDWCIKELRYKARIFEDMGYVTIYDADVVKSDSAVSIPLKEELKAAVKVLEDVPTHLKDWHPGTDEQVLDLVHPSLYPLFYGKSRILPDSFTTLDNCIERCGDGLAISVPEPPAPKPKVHTWEAPNKTPLYSTKFQWLPSEIDISNGSPRITSYINNLHPRKHPNIYSIVEKVIENAIPLWNASLTPNRAKFIYGFKRFPEYKVKYDLDGVSPDELARLSGIHKEKGEVTRSYQARIYDWAEDNKKLVMPEPFDTFRPPSESGPADGIPEVTDAKTGLLREDFRVDLIRDYQTRGLQVIVKLANIHLSPDKPKYQGGSWHVEGQLNEHICATAILYYDNENITPSALAFRRQVDSELDDFDYGQDDSRWLEEIFGGERDGPAIQDMGSVTAKEGRLITFPNFLQHQVQPFKLADPTKPGHRKILALFLVDPGIRIISTANVPCQRKDWWKEAVMASERLKTGIPVELQTEVLDMVEEFPIGEQEAKDIRTQLMDERSFLVHEQDSAFCDNQFNLCEH